MTVSDETLMAYADGELDAVAREMVDAQLRKDPRLERRIAQHRRLREKLSAAYAAELSEPAPQALLGLLGDAGAARSRAMKPNLFKASSWRPFGALAASVVLGIGIGYAMWHRTAGLIAGSATGTLVARGELAEALSSRLAASPPAASEVQIGLSFVAKSGDVCRTFSIQSAQSSAGIACRQDGAWQIETLAPHPQAEDRQGYRQAASDWPQAVVKSVEEQMSGQPLDQDAEAAARSRGWRP